jgi:hypothetical protein
VYKLFAVLSFLFWIPSLAFSQADWLKRAGGSSPDLANGLWADNQGSVFITGSVSGSAKFFKTEVFSRGGGDVYVAKFNSGGSLVWVKTFGGKLDDFSNAITGDPDGNIYITGVFTDSASFDQIELEAKGSELFVAKLNSKGNIVWAKSLETSGTAISSTIAVTDQGGAFIGGVYSGNLDSKIKWQMGQTDGFVCKLDWEGNRTWTKVFGGAGFDEVNVLRTDPWGRVLVGAVFDQHMFVNEQELEGQSSKSGAAILYESTGSLVWTKVITGQDAQCTINDAVTDLQGTCYLAGKFSGETQFGEVAASSKGQTDAFLTAIDKNGNLRWISTIGGSETDDATVLELLPDGKSLLMAGQFNKFITHGHKTITAEYDNQFFMARWDNRGNLDELRKLPFYSTFTCEGRKINSQGKLNLCGSFTGKANFGKQSLVSAGEEDIFISVLSDPKILR